VARAHAVGVDLERWSEGVEYLELAERFFSPGERRALRALAHVPDLVEAGFFAAWTRKEAYLKATGHGITRGLHHFDVALAPGEPARLLADRLDADATARWTMFALDPAPGYSAALVAASPIGEVLQFTV
jgi:4'-phosphopantetheinyl transferase